MIRNETVLFLFYREHLILYLDPPWGFSVWGNAHICCKIYVKVANVYESENWVETPYV